MRKIALGCEYVGVVKRHCLAIAFSSDIEGLEQGNSQGGFAKQLRTVENLANSESRRKKFGKAETYDGSIIPANPNSNSAPGSGAVYDRQKGKGKPKGKSNLRNSKGAIWAEEIGGNNEENYQYEQEERENQNEENEDMEVTQARGSKETESDIDWGELDRYTDSEIENHFSE